jgi:Flp pilus assembly pilin Flp
MRLYRNKQGQATTEYILILAFVVALIATLFKGLLLPQLKNAEARLEKNLNAMFSGDNLHHLNFRIPKK